MPMPCSYLRKEEGNQHERADIQTRNTYPNKAFTLTLLGTIQHTQLNTESAPNKYPGKKSGEREQKRRIN